jgi:ketosteroid isomerase-like protein
MKNSIASILFAAVLFGSLNIKANESESPKSAVKDFTMRFFDAFKSGDFGYVFQQIDQDTVYCIYQDQSYPWTGCYKGPAAIGKMLQGFPAVVSIPSMTITDIAVNCDTAYLSVDQEVVYNGLRSYKKKAAWIMHTSRKEDGSMKIGRFELFAGDDAPAISL